MAVQDGLADRKRRSAKSKAPPYEGSARSLSSRLKTVSRAWSLLYCNHITVDASQPFTIKVLLSLMDVRDVSRSGFTRRHS